MTELIPKSAHTAGRLLNGRYRLEERIGQGAMAVVYRARDEALGRKVAVKLFRGTSADTASMARNAAETRLLASLNHHSLVTLFDASMDSDNDSYLVMEYVEGPTLAGRIALGPIDPTQVAVMVRDLAEALHVVHQAGVVHRDIKPSNVLLRLSHTPGEGYRATLADFGIAYLMDSTRVTTPGTLIGTAAYLSPEQVRGEAPAPSSDIYSLGLVLIESLTGERVFLQTGTHEVALARLSNNPRVPSEFGYAWKSLLAAMTARTADQRPTALEVMMAVRGFVPGDTDPTITGVIADPTSDFTAPAAAPGTTENILATTPTEPEFNQRPHLPDPNAIENAPGTRPVPDPAVANTKRRSTWHVVAALGAVIIAGLVVAALIWITGTPPANEPTPAPTLPSLTEPLNTHMNLLLEAVKP